VSFSHIIRQCVCSSTIRFVPCAFSINKQFRTCTNAFPNEFTVRSYEYCAGKHWILYWIQENKTATYFRRSRLFTYDIDFNFKIVNFPNMCSNIQASPAYGVCISQFFRYARASSNYSDFLKRHLYLRNRLLDQRYKKIRLIRSLKKFIFRYQDLVEIYSVFAETIINDEFS
jgi:hypothetical protein